MVKEISRQSTPAPPQLNVLTWGTRQQQPPLHKAIRKGLNTGHGAFMLNLPSTPENTAYFKRLLADGYPGTKVKRPMSCKIIFSDGSEKFVAGPAEERLIIRYSAYRFEYMNAKSDQLTQRKGREQRWNEEFHTQLSSPFAPVLDGSSPENLPEPIDRAFQASVRENHGHSALRWDIDECNRGIRHTFFPWLIRDEDAKYWQQYGHDFSNEKYETWGCPPDHTISLPFVNKKFLFGLHLQPILRALIETQRDKHHRFYRLSKKYLSADREKQYLLQQQLELKGAEFQDTAGFVLTPYHERNELYRQLIDRIKTIHPSFKQKKKKFDSMMAARDILFELDAQNKLSETDCALLGAINALLKENQVIALIADAPLKSPKEFFQNNCCRQVIEIIRAGLDPCYRGYLSDPYLGLVPPGHLLDDVLRLSSAIEKDRQQLRLEYSDSKNLIFSTPPYKRYRTAALKTLANRNIRFIPSRTVVRPAFKVLSKLSNST